MKINKFQQKGLEDYKLATANASINADFSMEDHCHELVQGVAAASLEGGDATNVAAKQEKSEKHAKEVWYYMIYIAFDALSVSL